MCVLGQPSSFPTVVLVQLSRPAGNLCAWRQLSRRVGKHHQMTFTREMPWSWFEPLFKAAHLCREMSSFPLASALHEDSASGILGQQDASPQ